MTSIAQQPSIADVEQALGLAVRAPSIHNTQPWRWALTPDALELYADPSRQLAVLDPDGRAVLISCGAALYLACLGLGAHGWPASVERFPDPARPQLLARICCGDRRPVDEPTRALAAAAARRHTERRPFAPRPVPLALLDELRASADTDGGYAHLVLRADERLDLAVGVSWADSLESTDPEYRAELARWVRPDAHAAGEGIAASAVPHLVPGQQRHAEVPVRDFEVGHRGDQPVPSGVDEQPVWLVLFSTGDDADSRLRAGEAYARVSVEAERMGLATSAVTQALDLPGVRDRLQMLMSWPDHPQMIVRMGWPPAGDPAPPSPRRPVEAVLTVADDPA